MGNPILRAENLKKFYSERLALEIPHLDFESGGIYALVGPNGAGKTTLLRMLNLLEQPTEGTIYFDGAKIGVQSSDALNIRRKMTLVMQNPVLFRTTVYKNVAYGLSVRLYDREMKKAAVSNALKMVGLAGFEHRKARELSAGEAQRVALARALILEPSVLFLDEPTANVDRRNIQIFESLIKKVNSEQGTTVIFTTHDLSQAYRMTDRIISLLDGKVMECSPENIFYGSIEEGNGQVRFINISPSLKIMFTDQKSGATGIYISPEDVAILPDPIQSEQWNCLEGRITSLSSENGNMRLAVNVGVELVAIVSSEDFHKIKPDIFNERIYAAFKVSDVHVF